MLVVAAVVPEAPLLLPGATGGPVEEVEEIRATARAAADWLLEHDLDAVVAVAGAERARTWPAGTPSGLGRHTGARTSNGEVLPVGLAVATSLAPGRPLTLQSVAHAASPADARNLGAALAAAHPRVGLLVAGDGSARRGPKAPGYLDDRAFAFDAKAEHALTSGDAAALLALDADLAADLLVAGRAAWQVLAGAAAGRQMQARLDYAGDPFGVEYFVARWWV